MENTPNFNEEEKKVLGLLEQVADYGMSFVVQKNQSAPTKAMPETVVISKFLETEDRVFYRLAVTQADATTIGLLEVLHLILNALTPQPGSEVVKPEIWTPGKPTGGN